MTAAALKKLRHVEAYILRTALLDPSVRLWKSLYDIFGCRLLFPLYCTLTSTSKVEFKDSDY